MATTETVAECMTILCKVMPNNYTQDTENMLAKLLLTWDDDLCKIVVTSILETKKYAPTYNEIVDMLKEMIVDLPNEENAYAEVIYFIDKVGVYGKKHDTIRGLKVPGCPEFSHPIIYNVVMEMGGWFNICSDKMVSGTFKAQFRDAFKREMQEWRKKAAVYAALPASKRPEKWFPKYKPLELTENKPNPKQITSNKQEYPIQKLIGSINVRNSEIQTT